MEGQEEIISSSLSRAQNDGLGFPYGSFQAKNLANLVFAYYYLVHPWLSKTYGYYGHLLPHIITSLPL